MTRISTLLIGAGLVALQGCAATGTEEDIASTSSAVTSGSAVMQITSDWGTGYCANVVLTNALSVQTARWQVLIDFKGLAVPAAPWNTTFVTNGKYTTAQPASYNTEIAPNGTASFGFCGSSTTGGVRPSIVAYNMEMDLFTTCSSNSGVNPTLAGLAVAMATELGRWEPDLDLQVSGGKVILNPAAVCLNNTKCANTKAILGQQAYTPDQNTFNNTNYSSTLQSMFQRQRDLINNIAQYPSTQWPGVDSRNNGCKTAATCQLPPYYKLTLKGGPVNLGYGNCGPHYIYEVDYASPPAGAPAGTKPSFTDPTQVAGNKLTAQDAANMINTLCFFGEGSCGNNPYIGALTTNVPGCAADKTCIAIDPTDGDNGSTSTTTAGSAPTYPKNMVYDPANTLLGTQCITTRGKLGTMVSQCSTMPDTCGNLYCFAN